MLRQLLSLYRRYTAAHLTLTGRPSAILGNNGNNVGHIDSVTVHQGRLRVKGWVHASKVTLVCDNMEARTVPRHRREDVAQARNLPAEVGFEIDLMVNPNTLSKSDPPTLICDAIDARTSIRPVPLIMHRIRLNRLVGLSKFSWSVLRLLPAIVGWYATHDSAYRARVKAGLGLNKVFAGGELNPQLFAPHGAAANEITMPDPARITLVLPVYNAFELLAPVLARVEENTDLPWRLILIEDGSSDERVRPFLRDWVEQRGATHDVTLIEHVQNKGFIAAVNAGLEHAMAQNAPKVGLQEGPVILLNSDAFVPPDWASRLIRPMQLNKDIATVTPMSNDAEIFSVPSICTKTALSHGQVDQIDAVARTLHPDSLLVQAPTGVGFCMAMSRKWLVRVSALDPVFGRGYGEEVDWCQKTAQLGGQHIVAPNLFVEHRGGESFGSANKRALVAKNNEIISKRYPEYDAQVQAFIRSDPAVTPRLALGMAWAASLDQPDGTAVYLAHSLGGGAETYLEGQIDKALEQGAPVVVLRVGGMRRWQIELHTPLGVTRGSTDDTALVQGLVGLLSRRRIIYSCGVGDTNPVGLPADLAALATGSEDSIEVLFHDFFPLSPSYTLLDSDGLFRGAPDGARDDRAHRGYRADGSLVSLTEWQTAWRSLAQKAQVLRVFSEDSANHVRAVWPDLSDRIAVSPHHLPHAPERMDTLPKDAPIVIGVLGNIGFQKGAAVVQSLAKLVGKDASIKLVLIGNIDPSYALPRSVKVHGDYRPVDISALAVRYNISHWLIPSIWPETFSYTTREALATGRPVMAFDIGAQGEAVRQAPNGVPVHLPRQSADNATTERGAAGSAAQNLIETIKKQEHTTPDPGKARTPDKTTTRT